MKMNNPRTCGECRAIGGLGVRARCGLGYPIRLEKKRVDTSYMYIPVPDGPCPKPLTYDEMGLAPCCAALKGAV